MYDKVQVDVSLIKIGQVEAMEAFLPYLYDGKRDRTLYQIAKENGFAKLLPEHKEK